MGDPSNQAETLTITDAALRIGVSREAAIRLVQRGILQGGKHLDRWYATLESVERYLAESTAADPASA